MHRSATPATSRQQQTAAPTWKDAAVALEPLDQPDTGRGRTNPARESRITGATTTQSPYWFFALMVDEEAMKGHGHSEAMQAAMAGFGPLIDGPPRMTVTIAVAALGLDL